MLLSLLPRHLSTPCACALLLFAPAVLAAPAPAMTTTQFLPGDGTIQPAAGNQTTPAIATGPQGSLVVWADDRSSATNSVTYPSGSSVDIYAARLDANGQLLDAIPIVVAQNAADQIQPKVAWNGQDYLVVWTTQLPTDFYYSYGVAAARVTTAGVVLDRPALVPLRYASSSGANFAVATLGSDWAIVAEGNAVGEAGLLGARVSSAGALLDPTPVTVVPETYYTRANLELAGTADELLLTWDDLNDYRGLRLHPNLSPIEAASFDISGPLDAAQTSRLVSNGTDFLLVWETATYTTYEDYVRAARITHAGVVLDPTGIALTPNLGPITGRAPSAAWDGTRWWASYWKANGLCVTRLTAAGTVLDPAGIPVDAAHADNQSAGALAGVPGGGVRIAWQDTRAGGDAPYDIYRASVNGTGTVGPNACIALGAPREMLPAVARGTGGSLVAFASDVSGARRILIHALDAAGAPMLAQPIELASGRVLSGPSVAWNGAQYLVTWSDDASANVYARRVLPNGVVLDAAPILVMRGSNPDVAAVGDVFLVAATFAPLNPQVRLVFVQRVRGADGALLDASARAVGSSFAVRPRVAAYDDRWLVVYEGHFSHDDPHANVGCVLVASDGSTLSEFGFLAPTTYNDLPDVTAHGDTALVAWQDPRVSNADWNVYARRIVKDGTVLDAPGVAVSEAANNQGSTALAWTGTEFVAAFEDLRRQTFFLDARSDASAARLAANATLLDASGLVVFADSLNEIQPAVAPAETGGARIVASIFRDQAPFAALRIGMRVVDPALPVSVGASRVALSLAVSPNPVRTETAIHVSLPTAGRARVGLYDVRGALVRALHDGELPAGGSVLRWDGRDAAGRRIPAGVYLVRLEALGTHRESRVVRL